MIGLIVSYKTFSKIEERKSVYYFFPDHSNEIIALEPLPDIYARDGVGYVIIDDKFIKTIKIE